MLNSAPIKLLIVEDALSVAHMVQFAARMAWPDCRVTIVENGTDAIRRFQEDPPDLVVLDIELPPPDGFSVCRAIRETSQAPIMMLTVRDTTVDKVRAFEMGADDYLTKPFDHLELLARLRALVRRALVAASPHGAPESSQPDSGFSLDAARHEVHIRGGVIQLTSTECRLLDELVRHAGRVMPYRLLLERVWGPEYAGEDHYLKVFVRRLREKLGDDARNPEYIQTEWGVGYSFMPPHAR
jgi:DNA-binding response OmpR family regulator